MEVSVPINTIFSCRVRRHIELRRVDPVLTMSEKKNVVRRRPGREKKRDGATLAHINLRLYPSPPCTLSLSRRQRSLNHAVVTCAAAQIGRQEEEDDEEEVEPPSPARSRCPPSRLITFTQICR